MAANVFAQDLAATQYSTAATTFLATWDPTWHSGSSGTGVYPDGDFTIAREHGHHLIEFPFENDGDAVSQIVRQRYWQFAASFSSQALGTPAPNRADLLLIDEENFRDEGGGVISWDRVYATIPQAHDEFEDFPYQAQYMYGNSGSAGGSGSSNVLRLGEQTFTVASRVRCEFFHVKDLGGWDILLALRVIQFTDTLFLQRGAGNLALVGSIFVSDDAQIVAEDSKIRMWKYPIMQRRTRYVAGPTAEFWGTAINITS